MAPDPVYARWRDLLHEMPEAEPALRAYMEREADRSRSQRAVRPHAAGPASASRASLSGGSDSSHET